MVPSFKQLLAMSLVSGFMAVATELETRQTTDSASCAPLHLMVAGGCLVPCQTEVGLLSTTISNLTTAYPGASVYQVPYNGSQNQAMVSTPLMVAAANEYTQSCPNTPIVFVGYSLGGIVVMNTLCGGISANPNVVAAIVYGEETFYYPEVYDLGTCTNNAPLHPINRAQACAPFASAIHSWCDAQDPQCCSGGTNQTQHYQYPALYDVTALGYVEAGVAAWKAARNVSSSTSSAVASSTSMMSSSSSSSVVVPVMSSISMSTTMSSNWTMTASASTSASTTTTTTISTTPASSASTTTSPVPMLMPMSTSMMTSQAISSSTTSTTTMPSSSSSTTSSTAPVIMTTSTPMSSSMSMMATTTTAVAIYTGVAARVGVPAPARAVVGLLTKFLFL